MNTLTGQLQYISNKYIYTSTVHIRTYPVMGNNINKTLFHEVYAMKTGRQAVALQIRETQAALK